MMNDELGIDFWQSFEAYDFESLQDLIVKNYGKKLKVDYQFITPSTQESAKASKIFPSLFVSEEQTQGKGRENRVWRSQAGKQILMTLAYEAPNFLPASLSVALAISLSQALAQQFTSLAPHIKYKWPNDIYLGGKKCAGILIDTTVSSQECQYFIGIGCNIHNLGGDFSALADYEPSVSRNEVLTIFISSILDMFHSAKLLEKYLQQNVDFDFLLHKKIRVTSPQNQSIIGISRGIAKDGSLCLEEIQPASTGVITKIYQAKHIEILCENS